MSDEPKQPNIMHVMEQMTAAYRDFALTTATYFKGLCAAGMTREEALTLTVAWQNTVLSSALRPKDKDSV